MFGIAINSYAMSFYNLNSIRKSVLVTSPMVLVYYWFVMLMGGMRYEAVVIVSSVIGIIRYRKSAKN